MGEKSRELDCANPEYSIEGLMAHLVFDRSMELERVTLGAEVPDHNGWDGVETSGLIDDGILPITD